MDHGHHVATTNVKALRISAILILIYFVFEITIAFATGSLSLLADAGHELSTFIAISFSLIAIQLAKTKPTAERTFGLLRIEILAAFINGLLLLGMAAYIVWQGIERINHPMEVPPGPMFVMAIGGIGLEIASLMIMFKGQKEDLNIRGSFWHVINAFLGSLAVIIAAVFINFWGIYAADAWAGIIFAFILTYAAYGIIKDSVSVLIDVTPSSVNLTELSEELRSIPGVVSTHHLHARTITGQIRTFSGHLVIANFKNSGEVLAKAKHLVDHKYGFSMSTIQLEEKGTEETDLKSLEADL